MIKKIICLLVIIAVSICFLSTSVFAVDNSIVVMVDGKIVDFPDAKPFIKENKIVMCPVRHIAEALGAEVGWQGKNGKVTISTGKRSIEFLVWSNKAAVNGIEMTMKENSSIYNKRTYVPLQFISETFDVIVDWNYKTRVLNICKLKINEEEHFGDNGITADDRLRAENLDAFMDAYQKATNFQGAVLVAKDGDILINNGYGMADSQQGTKNTSQTRFAIGSVTKQFTAMAIMQLQEKGLLSVEEKLSKYYPDFNRGNEISIHHLLTHSSGIPNYTDIPEYISQVTKIIEAEDIISFMKERSLDFDPGKDYKYSNTGYLILGRIIEKVSGISYGEYLKKNIFDPLGMKDTGVCYENGNKGSQAWGHMGFLDVVRVDDESITKIAHAAGSMYSTVEDLYRWDRALYTEALVSKSTMDKVFTPYIDSKGMGQYGYGWFILDGELGRGIMHGGYTSGFTADFRRYVDKDLAIIVLANKDHMNTSNLFTEIKNILLGKGFEIPKEKHMANIEKEVYKEYAGSYELTPGTTIRISNDNGHLYAGITGQGFYEIYPETETKFFYRITEAEITFIRNDKGDVIELILKQNGQELHARNMKFPKAEAKEMKIDQKVFDAYTGEYEIAAGLIVSVFAEDGRYYMRLTGQEKFEIFGETETEFFSKIVDARVTFIKNDNGEVTGLTIKQSGIQVNAKKIK